jgi:hypothetical protein
VFHYKVTGFDEIVGPMSRGKVLVLLRVSDPARCDQIDCYQALLKGIGVAEGTLLLESFLERGFLAAETTISEDSTHLANQVVDYFRGKKLQEAVQAYLFIDGNLVEHSGDGKPSVQEVLAELGCQYAT